jgi:uncharacterized protein (TIGR00255 family)
MTQSMTGFATTTLNISSPEGAQTQVIMSLKTLNSRQLEITCKIAPVLLHLETQFIKVLKEKLVRGHVFLNISMNNFNIFQTKVEPSITVAKNYVHALQRIQKECNLPGEVTVSDMLRIANNIFTLEQTECDKTIEASLLDAMRILTEALIATRMAEGAVLQQDIQSRHDIIKKTMSNIGAAAQRFLEQKKEAVAQKIAALETETPEFIAIRKSAFHSELDKIDIHEEIVRFNAHLENLNKLLQSDEQEKGRHIGFLLQELGREINTLSAKCSDVELGNYAITVKVELEKIREQAQNIV